MKIRKNSDNNSRKEKGADNVVIKSVKIKDVKVGDTVITPNGTASVIKTIKEYVPTRMFVMVFPEGKVKCSYNHLWTVYKNGSCEIFDTLTIFNAPKRGELFFGEPNGPRLISIKEIPPEKVCCIEIDSEDKLFAIDLPKGKIFTHNCQFRAACGRLGSIASMMLFGNTMATTIDGSHPGAGMISANGAISSIQYYYEDVSWIQKFYKICGYDNTGHRPHKGMRYNNGGSNNGNNSYSSNDISEAEEDELDEFNKSINSNKGSDNMNNAENRNIGYAGDINDTDDIDDLDNIFNFEHDIAKIEIEGISGEVDKTKRQKFEQ